MNGIYLYFVNQHRSSWPLLGLLSSTVERIFRNHYNLSINKTKTTKEEPIESSLTNTVRTPAKSLKGTKTNIFRNTTFSQSLYCCAIIGIDSFNTQLLKILKQKPFENIVGKGENAGNQQLLLFRQCFLLITKREGSVLTLYLICQF